MYDFQTSRVSSVKPMDVRKEGEQKEKKEIYEIENVKEDGRNNF